MHRTQITLEDKHYEFLKEISTKEKKSMSRILREIIELYSEKKDIFSITSIAGIGEDPEVDGSDHDRWIYR